MRDVTTRAQFYRRPERAHRVDEVPAPLRRPKQHCACDVRQGQFVVEGERLLRVPKNGFGSAWFRGEVIVPGPDVGASGDGWREIRLLVDYAVELCDEITCPVRLVAGVEEPGAGAEVALNHAV
jgi:hypothetical protein